MDDMVNYGYAGLESTNTRITETRITYIRCAETWITETRRLTETQITYIVRKRGLRNRSSLSDLENSEGIAFN